MTEVERRSGVQVMRLGEDRASLVGGPGPVAGELARLSARGVRYRASEPQPVGDGRVLVMVTRLPDVVARPVSRPTRAGARGAKVAAAAGAGAAVATGVGVGAYLLLSWVVAHLVVILGVLAAVALGVGALSRGGCTTIVKVTHRH